MERTIDGTDYIAMSEVLRIIDEDIEDARIYANDKKIDYEYRYGWSCRENALVELRDILTSQEEQ